MTDAAAVAATYFDAWKARDFGRLRSVLADDVDFAGPLGRVRGGDDCLRGLQGMAQIMTGIDVRRVFHDEPDVLTWFDLSTSVAALPGALHEAGSARRLAALRLAGLGGISAVSVVTSDEVASHELLLATVPPSVLRSFRERLLGPLLTYDDQHRAELLPTLREFLACSGSWNACAVRMYVHVNTVRYRIRRIEELTGRDLSRLDDQVDFFLALRIR